MFDGSAPSPTAPSPTAQSPTVTIYARHTPLITAIADEVRARGASTHTVSIETGWVPTVSRALLVLDSPAGISAVRGLCEAERHGARVVALVADNSDVDVEDLCDQCMGRHDLVIVRSGDDDVIERTVDELVGSSSS